jgi:hypothetical protein
MKDKELSAMAYDLVKKKIVAAADDEHARRPL